MNKTMIATRDIILKAYQKSSTDPLSSVNAAYMSVPTSNIPSMMSIRQNTPIKTTALTLFFLLLLGLDGIFLPIDLMRDILASSIHKFTLFFEMG